VFLALVDVEKKKKEGRKEERIYLLFVIQCVCGGCGGIKKE
jgi:hypothetical protein